MSRPARHGTAAPAPAYLLASLPIAIVAFALTWLLPEIRLRRGIDPNDAEASPDVAV